MVEKTVSMVDKVPDFMEHLPVLEGGTKQEVNNSAR